jgi:hypothetical protein
MIHILRRDRRFRVIAAVFRWHRLQRREFVGQRSQRLRGVVRQRDLAGRRLHRRTAELGQARTQQERAHADWRGHDVVLADGGERVEQLLTQFVVEDREHRVAGSVVARQLADLLELPVAEPAEHVGGRDRHLGEVPARQQVSVQRWRRSVHTAVPDHDPVWFLRSPPPRR